MMRAFVLLTVAMVFAPSLEAQRPKRCTGEPADSALMAAGPIYRDCEVDRPARLKGAEPRLSVTTPPPRTMREGCFYAELEFVVNADGTVDPATVQVRRSDFREFTEAMVASVGQLRYEPARKDDRAVRQVVVHRRGFAVAVTTSSTGPGGSGGGGLGAAPPRCR